MYWGCRLDIELSTNFKLVFQFEKIRFMFDYMRSDLVGAAEVISENRSDK